MSFFKKSACILAIIITVLHSGCRSSEPVKPSEDGVLLGDVPVCSQMPEYPTGCESVSAVIALSFAHEEVTVDEFIDRFLPTASLPYEQDGILYGPDPYQHFVGDPRRDDSFGCMAPVIEKALAAYLADRHSDRRVMNVTGATLDSLCRDYIDHGVPVMVWVTIDMVESYPSVSWHLPSGEEFVWPANEHCMVLVGYDRENYYFSDPYRGRLAGYDRERAEQRYTELGMQALVME